MLLLSRKYNYTYTHLIRPHVSHHQHRRYFPPTDFKKDNPLYKIINRNTVKVFYSCTINVKSLIDSHNQKILQDEKREAHVSTPQ